MSTFRVPWGKRNYSNLLPNEQLTQEIKDFVEWIEPTPDETQIRFFTIMKYTKFIEYLINNGDVETFTKKGYKGNKKYSVTVVGQGSSFTNCFIPNSDIDLIVLGLPDDISISDCLYKIVNQLWHSRLINNAIVLKHAKVPIAKIVDRQFGIHIDISIGQINGALNIERVLNYFSSYPLLRSILLFMKVFTLINDIHDPAKGGFGSNHMMLIIIFVIQQNPDIKTEGDLLIAVFEFLTAKMNIFLTGISTNNGGFFFSKFQIEFAKQWPHSIICQDPQYPENFYGIRSKQSLTLVESCRRALNIIRSNIAQQNKQVPVKQKTSSYFSRENALSSDYDSDVVSIEQPDSSYEDNSNNDSDSNLNNDSDDYESSDVVDISSPTILSRILDEISVVTKRRKEFIELAALWRLPAREYNAKMATRDQILRSRSTPNLKKEKSKPSKQNEDRKIKNIEIWDSRNSNKSNKNSNKNNSNFMQHNDNKNNRNLQSNSSQKSKNFNHSFLDKRNDNQSQDVSRFSKYRNDKSNGNNNYNNNNNNNNNRSFGKNFKERKKPYKR